MGKKRFVNPHMQNVRKTFWDACFWKLGYYDDAVESPPMPEGFTYPAAPFHFEEKAPKAVWIGHSTYLIEMNGLTILTDPVWDHYCSPVPLRALRRTSLPPIALADLPPIDIVLISHNHYDHLDAKTVAILHKFHPQIEWIVPKALAPWFLRRGITPVREVGWWETYFTKNCAITGVPAQHFSGRGLLDQNKTHWGGYVVETAGKKIYFTGDTGYNPHDFKAIGKKFARMDLSLIPIGTYTPKKFMEPVHISPYEAVKIHREVGSQLSLGMHWNTFKLSDEPLERPPFDLYLAMKKKNLPLESFLPIDIGVYVNF